MPHPPTPSPERTDPEDRAFLATYDPQAFDRPSVAVDLVLLAPVEGGLGTLLLRRTEPPFKGLWALPGGFVGMQESLESAAERVLHARTGLRDLFLEQLYTFGAPHRDPRMRILSVAYYALVDRARFEEVTAPHGEATVARLAEGDGGLVLASPEGQALELAFDHRAILATALARVRGKLDYTPIGFELLPSTFSLLELQRVHEAVLGRKLNKDSFRRRLLASGQLEATGEIQQDVDHRPATLYRFLRKA